MALLLASSYLALAFVEFSAIFKGAIASPGFKQAGPILASEACFQQPGFKHYEFVGKRLDQLNCILNSTFIAGGRTRLEGNLQLSVFAGLLLTSVMIGLYESFRGVHRRSSIVAGAAARAASPFLLLGQRFTAGFTTPIHYMFVVWSAASGSSAAQADPSLDVPAPEYVWTALLSGTIGYLAPTVYMMWVSDLSYEALSIWQPFPVYTLALSIVLPPIVRAVVIPALPFSRTQSRRVGTVAIALLCTVVSVATYWHMLAHTLLVENGVDIRDVFLLRLQPAEVLSTLAHASHVLFTIDFASVLLVSVIAVLGNPGGSGVIRSVVPFTLMAVSAGPAAALAISWATAELSRQSRADAITARLKAK